MFRAPIKIRKIELSIPFSVQREMENSTLLSADSNKKKEPSDWSIGKPGKSKKNQEKLDLM